MLNKEIHVKLLEIPLKLFLLFTGDWGGELIIGVIVIDAGMWGELEAEFLPGVWMLLKPPE